MLKGTYLCHQRLLENNRAAAQPGLEQHVLLDAGKRSTKHPCPAVTGVERPGS
jgi:hypothetical protein